jgi:hypothetical protein
MLMPSIEVYTYSFTHTIYCIRERHDVLSTERHVLCTSFIPFEHISPLYKYISLLGKTSYTVVWSTLLYSPRCCVETIVSTIPPFVI